MLLTTGKGHYLTAVEDFDQEDLVWVRSQDRASVQRVIDVMRQRVPIPDERVTYELIAEPTWDYEFRVKLTKGLFGIYLAEEAQAIDYYKLKPAVAEARGKTHPISRMVEEVFYYMSYNRPDGSKPAWLTGGTRRR